MEFSAVPTGTGGIYYISGRKVYSVQRGEKPVWEMRDQQNVMGLQEGPNGSVLCWIGANPKAYALRVWFPAEGKHISIPTRLLGPRLEPYEVKDMFWSETTRHFYVVTSDALLTIPEAVVMGLDRLSL